MSNNNIIGFLLNLKDKNITFTDKFFSKTVNGVTYKDFLTLIDQHFTTCTNCNSPLIKYGTKSSYIKLPKVYEHPSRLLVKKQRYKCPHCNKIYTSQSRELVNANCFISNNVKLAISTALINDSTRNIKSIARQFGVSPHTVWRILESQDVEKKINPFYLPEKLCFDEIKSTKSCVSSMSFVYCDAEKHELLAVLPSRKKDDVINHFHRYTLNARKRVKEICMDIHSPYIEVVKAVFPNAKIVFDRFHIVQLMARSLNSTRIKFMNSVRKNNQVLYKRLKNNWRLFVKDRNTLSMERTHYNKSYKALISESEIVEDLLKHVSEEFRETYYTYQELLYYMKTKNSEKIEECIKSYNNNISETMKTSLKTLKKYKEYTVNGVQSKISNGPMEGINNIIKLQKRISFGFKNFKHFKIKIFYAVSNKTIKAA